MKYKKKMVTQSQIEEVRKGANVSSSIAREALELGERKIAGQRIPFRDDQNLSRAKAFVFNQPEFLRRTSFSRPTQSFPAPLQSFPKKQFTPIPKARPQFTPIPKVKPKFTPIPKPKQQPLGKKIITFLSKRQKRLIEVERKREIKIRKLDGRKLTFKQAKAISSKSEREFLETSRIRAEIFGLTAGKVVLQNLRAFKELPENVLLLFKKIKKDPSSIKKLPKGALAVLKEEGKAGIELFRTSPTEAVAVVGSNLLFFAGTGKVLKLVGKIAKGPAKLIKKSLGKKKGTRLVFVGTQTQKGNVITTKVVFRSGKKQIGGAVGVSKIKGGKILTQTVGVVGKGKIKKVAGKPRIKKFKQKGVFAGRQISVAKRKTLRVRRRIAGITVTRDVSALAQLGIGRVATARGDKLLRTVVKFPTATLKKKKVKSLRVKDFVSISAVLTKKDLSLIVGKTLSKKKDVTDFIGLIKGISKKDIQSFSGQKQKLFRQALQDVAGTISASTTRGKKIIPKLSPKSRKAILKRVSGRVIKGKVFVGVRVLQKAKVRQKVKVILKVKQRVIQKPLSKEKLKLKLKPIQKQKNILLQKSKLSTAQKSKLILLQKQISVSESIGGFVPLSAIPKIKIPIGLIKRKKRRIVGRVKKGKQGFNVFGKSRGKFIKLNKTPLSRSQALDRGAFAVDKSTSARFKIRPIGQVRKLGKVTKAERGHFSKTRKKFRGVKIRKGKRIGLRNEFIEKRRRRIDTRGEKRGLSLAKFSKQRGFIGRSQPRRTTRGKIIVKRNIRSSPSRRTATPQQLKNLAKGRKILAQNRRRR